MTRFPRANRARLDIERSPTPRGPDKRGTEIPTVAGRNNKSRYTGMFPIHSLMAYPNPGDGVSAIALDVARRLGELGHPGRVLAHRAHPTLARDTCPLPRGDQPLHASLWFHYWGHSEFTPLLDRCQGRTALHYHNITPPQLMSPGSPMRVEAELGLEQLANIADRFDLIVGDSSVNVRAVATVRRTPTRGMVLFPAIDRAAWQRAAWDDRLESDLRAHDDINILFVGRLARHKRQDALMRAFDRFCRSHTTKSRLWLVGSAATDTEFAAELEGLRRELPRGDRIHLTGALTHERLIAHYRAADVFLSASEHEGFCMPIAEAMAFDVPVVARAAAAVPETLGDSGVLLAEWDGDLVVDQLLAITRDAERRRSIVDGQRRSLDRFHPEMAAQRVAAAAAFLASGRVDARLIRDPAVDVRLV
jgi:glycosyltransferase involved in cell wall biosynthesis